MSTNSFKDKIDYDAVLIGAGIMSTTLALLLKEAMPEVNILIIEKLDSPGKESTGVLSNAGTGHAANCELNYTPLVKNRTFDLTKALSINNAFETSLELWASLYEKGNINIENFLRFVPHISFVSGENNCLFLLERFKAMSEVKEFKEMMYTDSFKEISEWTPLITDGRPRNEIIAATKISRGTDINFEALTKEYLSYLTANNNLTIHYSSELINLNKTDCNNWELEIIKSGRRLSLFTRYVFLGAGGKTINLLQKSKIPEAKIYGGFPVSGKWLICDNKELSERHNAKVYGKANIGAPPMSVPHLDTRWINGKKSLLFGPFAGFTTKFLKQGSYFDLFSSIKKDNIFAIFDVGLKNSSLVNYLFSQSLQSHNERIENLKLMMPTANVNDWFLQNAGQRVQIIKKINNGGKLQFGTEVVNSADGSLSALLGASPGASTAVKIMIKVLIKSLFFREDKAKLEKKLRHLVSFGLKSNIDDYKNTVSKNNAILGFHK